MPDLWEKFSIEIPKPLNKALKKIAAKQNMAQNDLICEMLAEVVEKRKDITILIIDDDDEMRALIKEYIDTAGIGVVIAEATDGNEGLEMYLKFHPSIVLLDVLMPFQDGVQTLQNILFHDLRAKVIMVSVIKELKYVTEFMKAGASNYVTKPFTPDGLIKTIVDTMYSYTYQSAYEKLKEQLKEDFT